MPTRNQNVILAILERASNLSGQDISNMAPGVWRSSIYAALTKSQHEGYVKSEWDVSGRRPQRRYKITEEGRKALAVERALLTPASPERTA